MTKDEKEFLLGVVKFIIFIFVFYIFFHILGWYKQQSNYNIMHDEALQARFHIGCIDTIHGRYPSLLKTSSAKEKVFICHKGLAYCTGNMAGQYRQIITLDLPGSKILAQCVQDINRGGFKQLITSPLKPIAKHQPGIILERPSVDDLLGPLPKARGERSVANIVFTSLLCVMLALFTGYALLLIIKRLQGSLKSTAGKVMWIVITCATALWWVALSLAFVFLEVGSVEGGSVKVGGLLFYLCLVLIPIAITVCLIWLIKMQFKEF